jgi:hypothetical protein
MAAGGSSASAAGPIVTALVGVCVVAVAAVMAYKKTRGRSGSFNRMTEENLNGDSCRQMNKAVVQSGILQSTRLDSPVDLGEIDSNMV